MGPRSRDLWGRTQGSRWGWCDGLPRRPARRTCWRVWNWRFAERGVTGWSRATGARSASRARWGRSTQPQAGNPGKRLAARHEQLIRAPGSAVSRLLCKRPRRLIFRAGYTGCTRAEGGALRRRTPRADSAAGIRRGRAQLDPGVQLILAVMRKISGVWGQSPHFNQPPSIRFWAGRSARRRASGPLIPVAPGQIRLGPWPP